uniref:Large ribosomal subunit protein uL10m n=1 Tax=Mandrillus leucophaeus TaxID=9568 RepID=A0A2K5XEC9_MANLE
MLRGGLLPQAGQLPALQTVCYGSKAVTCHHRVMHFRQQKLIAVTEYIPQTPAVNPTCLPSPPGPQQEERGLIRLLHQKLAAVFQDNEMITVCQKVALSTEDKLLMQHQLRKCKILMKVFPNQVPKPFLEDFKCQNLLPLSVGHNVLLVSEEPRVKEMVRILRTVSFLPLLGRCISDTILSRQGIINYSNLPSLPLARGELVVGLIRLTQREKDSVLSVNGKPDHPDPVPDSYPTWLASPAHKYTVRLAVLSTMGDVEELGVGECVCHWALLTLDNITPTLGESYYQV